MAIQSRGLTARAVLKRLREIDVVAVDKANGTVVLTQEDKVFIGKDGLDLLEVGLTAVGNLISTVNHNIQNSMNEDARYFQRGSWNYQFNPENIEHVRSAIHRYLRKMDAQSRDLITSLAEAESQKGQLTAGISMFYFEERSLT